MTGKPAARITDKVKGGVIVTGSATVLIGSQGGIACSVCPGGMAVGSPVNPQLGAKVLVGESELDFALPGALPLVWQRQYSSYVNAEQGAACGALGHGWKLPQHISLELGDESCLLLDAAGRVIRFEPLAVGQQHYSASEDLWLLRGGGDATWASQPRWAHVPASLAANADAVLAASGQADVLWVFAPAPAAPAALLTQRWRLIAQLDRFGRTQRYEYADGTGQQQDSPQGHLIALTDGVGRRYRLHYQRLHRGKPAQGLLQADDGWRLQGVDLIHDPVGSGALPLTLVRYGYSPQGDLLTVHDRAGVLVREFEVEHHRITAHRQRGGPWHRYRYASAQPGAKVIEHSNEQGLSYRFEYLTQAPSPEGKPRALTRVTDSLGRVDGYHFEGVAGLARLVLHERADGSQMRYEYDGAARLVAATDPLGRTTRLARDGQGRITGMQLPGGIKSSRQYDEASGRLVQSQDPTGAITHYRHDEYGRLIEVEQADGGTERYAYPSPQEAPLICDSPHQIEDAKGGTKRLAFSDAGLLVRYTDCSQSTTEYRHDRFGELIEVIDALGQRTVHERDAQGRITATRLPNGQTERYAYNAQGQLSHIEPAEGETGQHAIELAYDLWGRLTQRTHGGLTLHFEYDLAGRLTRLINENQAQSRFAWDVMDRLTQEEGFDQRLQTYRWDAAGQLLEASDGNAAGQRSTHYRWDEAGRLAQRRLTATEAAPAQVHGYEWDPAGRLMAASVHLLKESGEQAQSRIEIERDALGRITGETQRLYKITTSSAEPLQIEFEHRIAHRLDALGNRQQSQLQGVGEIEWLLYGSGHVHGLQHEGSALIDFERDRLHRETGRTLQGQYPQGPSGALRVQRRWDALGRLQALASQGLQGQAQVPQVLVGQLSQRQYHYDALGQLTAVQTAQDTLRYGYDAAGRLRAMQEGGQQQRWDVDPAGNRLPGLTQAGQAAQANWAAQVHAHWRQQDFNLLGERQASAPGQGPITRWPDNRIGFTEHAAWRYDERGNRIEQISQHEGRQQLSYDGANQLIAVVSQGPAIGEAGGQLTSGANTQSIPGNSTSRYVYDALGRRLKKTSQTSSGHGAEVEHTSSYFGWDGDRLVHTEQIDPQTPEQRQITHTVYEPGSFTPLVQLSTTGQQQAKPHALVQALAAGLQDADEEDGQALAMVQAMLGAMPQQLQDSANRSMQHALQQGLSPSALAMLGDQGQNTLQRLTGLREQLEKQEQSERTPITVRHYHCDHLGTPLALTDQNQQIVWAARLDPWGNVEQEFNPNSIDQAIRLPGQHQDTDTGLYYNRHRYYDPAIGSYVNQDPIGLAGGNNIYEYALNIPTQIYDPTGLFIPLAVLAGVAGKALLGAAIGAGVEVGMQSGKQVLGQVKDSWDNGRPLAEINWKCIDINWRHVGVSAAVGTVAPGMLSTGKTVYSSGKALRALSGQAANTTARAAKLAARKGAHQKTIKDAVSTQAAWQGAKGVAKCISGEADEACED